MCQAHLASNLVTLSLCFLLQFFSLIFDLADYLFLEFFLSTLPHRLRIDLEILVTRMRVSFLPSLFVLPALFTLFVLRRLIVGQLGLIKLILQ